MFLENASSHERRPFSIKSHHLIGFGEERAKLAKYVQDELNLKHQNDAAVLDKFRKEAEQYRRNVLRKNLRAEPNHVVEKIVEEVPIAPETLTQQTNLITPIAYKIKRNKKQKFSPHHEEESNSSSSDSESEKTLKEGNVELIRLLKKKDKQILKQNEIMRKNERKINDMKKRIENLERETKEKEESRIQALENNSYDQIKTYISSMSKKIQENQSILEDNLINRKNKQEVIPLSNSKPKFHHEPIKLDRKNKKFISNPEETTYSESIDGVQSQKEFINQNGSVKSVFSNLGHIRNRLDFLSSLSEK